MPVVLYDHDAVGGKAEAHVVFDSLAVGQAQGKRAAELIEKMDKTPVKVARVKGNQGEFGTGQYEKGQDEFLKPLINSGKVEVVCEQYTQNWDPTLAQAFAEDCLTRSGGEVDVFIGMNDGTTGGSVAALISQGYQPGEKLVTGGQDATVEALRYIAQAWQDNSVLPGGAAGWRPKHAMKRVFPSVLGRLCRIPSRWTSSTAPCWSRYRSTTRCPPAAWPNGWASRRVPCCAVCAVSGGRG